MGCRRAAPKEQEQQSGRAGWGARGASCFSVHACQQSSPARASCRACWLNVHSTSGVLPVQGGSLSGLGVSMIDALSTLWLMGLRSEFWE